MKLTIIVAAFCAAFGTYAFASDDTVYPPETGSYVAGIFVDSTSGSGCLDSPGTPYAGQVSFSGLSGATDYVRVPIAYYGEAVSSVQTLTVTSGKGTTRPKGKFTWTGQGIGASWNYSGTFSASITEIGTHTFVMQISETYSSCTENLNVSLARVSADQ